MSLTEQSGAPVSEQPAGEKNSTDSAVRSDRAITDKTAADISIQDVNTKGKPSTPSNYARNESQSEKASLVADTPKHDSISVQNGAASRHLSNVNGPGGSTTESKKDLSSVKVQIQSEEDLYKQGYTVVVTEKKGFFGKAIPPKMPTLLALCCCFFNSATPGLGTWMSAPACFCVDQWDTKTKWINFGINLLAGLLQIVLAVVFIGWLWSILWAIEYIKPLKGPDDDSYR